MTGFKYPSCDECEICRDLPATSWNPPSRRLTEPPDPRPLGERPDANEVIAARLRCPLCGTQYDYERECGFQQDDHRLVRVAR
jgi:hypothetical protein